MTKEINHTIQVCLDKGCLKVLKQVDIVSYIYITYKQWYYTGKPIVSDAEFDRYEDMIKKEWPDNPVLNQVGLVHPTCKCCSK